MRNEIEVMRIIRVPPMGKLVVQVGNRRLESLAEVRDEGIRGRLLAAIGELVSFAGGYETLVDTGVAPPLASGASYVAPGEVEEESLTPEQEAFLASLEEELKATIQAAAPRTDVSLEDATVQLEAPPTPEPNAGPPNLVAEIDEILQKHVARDPSLRERHIHLEQPLAGTLQIRVDSKTYEHPNEIEEEKVRQAIKGALKEWESR